MCVFINFFASQILFERFDPQINWLRLFFFIIIIFNSLLWIVSSINYDYLMSKFSLKKVPIHSILLSIFDLLLDEMVLNVWK